MPDPAALRIELAKPEYASLNDADAATLFNSKTTAGSRPVITQSQLRNWSSDTGTRRKLETGISHPNDIVASICMNFCDYLRYGGDPMDLSSSYMLARIDALVTAAPPVFTPSDKSSLLALTTPDIPLASSLNTQPLTAADVAAIRGGAR
jgi:hypothetical protein